MTVTDLGSDRRMIDLRFRDVDGLIAAFLVPGEEGWNLIETGPASCRAALLDGLREAGVAPEEVVRVFLSHIHLDHAGGVGALVDALPRATFLVHERGAPHLIDPNRLVASARRAWGPAADPLWGPILPAAPSRVRALSGGERFRLRDGSLEAIATPGHASHHLSFFDDRTRTLFVGDSAGVMLPSLWRPRPAVPPPELDLEALFASLEAMERRAPDRLAYTHFGPAADPHQALATYRETVGEWRDVALSAAREDPSVGHVAAALERHERTEAAAHGAPPPSEDRGALVSGFDLAAQGFVRYFQMRGLLSR